MPIRVLFPLLLVAWACNGGKASIDAASLDSRADVLDAAALDPGTASIDPATPDPGSEQGPAMDATETVAGCRRDSDCPANALCVPSDVMGQPGWCQACPPCASPLVCTLTNDAGYFPTPGCRPKPCVDACPEGLTCQFVDIGGDPGYFCLLEAPEAVQEQAEADEEVVETLETVVTDP